MTAGAHSLDPFLLDVHELSEESASLEFTAAEALAQFSEALEPATAPTSLRDRILADIPKAGRFERFAESVAKLLDLGIDRARALLDRLDDPSAFSSELPGISFFWVEGGPSVANAVRGFLRVAAGTHFPDHEHVGAENVLVLQGSFVDPGRGLTFLPGDIDVMSAGSSHDYLVPADGPDLLLLSVTQVGVRVLGMLYSPRE